MALTLTKKPLAELGSAGASTTPAQKLHYFTGKKPAQAPAQKPQEGLFSGLSSGLEQSGEMGQEVNKNVMGMLTGSSFDSHRTQQRETLQRAAQNLRAQTGEQSAHLLGQGAANKSQQGVEQGILQSLSDNEVQTNIAQQEMQERGVKTAMDLANSQQNKNVQDKDLQMRRDELYGYTDPQGNHVMGARDLAQQMFNFEVDATGKKLDLAEREMLEQVRQFDTELDWRKKAKDMDLDEAETQRLWSSNEATLDRVFQTELQQIDHAFQERGWNFEAFMQNLGALDHEQEADIIRTFAKDAGFEIKEYGKARMEQAGSVIENIFTTGLGETGRISGENLEKLNLVYDEVSGQSPERFAASESLNFKIGNYSNGRWHLTTEAKNWANSNKGKLYKHSDGNIYVVTGSREPQGRGQSGYIELYNIENGTTKKKQGGSGTTVGSDTFYLERVKRGRPITSTDRR